MRRKNKDSWNVIIGWGLAAVVLIGAITYVGRSKEPTPAAPAPPAPAFSATDRAETGRWLRSLVEQYRAGANTGNPEFRRRTCYAANLTLQQAVGEAVRWKFTVKSLGTNWLGFGSDYAEFDTEYTYGFTRNGSKVGTTGNLEAYLFRETEIPTDIYSQVRVGDTVEIEGTVLQCELESVFSTRVVLDQVRPIRVYHADGRTTEIPKSVPGDESTADN